MTEHGVKLAGKPEKLIHLRVTRVDQGRELMISLDEKSPGEEITLQQYIRTDVSLSSIQSLSREIFSLLRQSTGNNGKGNAQRLKEAGQHLYDSIFPLQIKEKLATTNSRHLYLFMDDSLVGIPWEVLYDGESFFSLRFNMGRLVTTAQPISKKRDRGPRGKIKMLILADPRKDLPDSYQEGFLLSESLEAWDDSLEIYLDTTHIDFNKIFRQIPQFDIIHYAGHAVFNEKNPGLSGWYLEDGLLTAQDIIKISGGKKNFPHLIFSNACQSGQTSEWSASEPQEWVNRAFDLVNVFLRCGVQHYIGTFQDISDPASLDLALSFYRSMTEECSVGESLRRARLQLINKYDKDNLIWAFYMLYGDPTVSYFRQQEEGKYVSGHMGLQSKSHDTRDNVTDETCCASSVDSRDALGDYARDDKSSDISDDTRDDTSDKMGRTCLDIHIKNPEKGPDKHPEKEKIISQAGPVKRTRNIDVFERQDQGPGIHQNKETKKIANRRIKMAGLFMGGAFLLLICVILIYLFSNLPHYRHTRHDPFEKSENQETDLAWEKEKWRIVHDIQAKLNERYSDQKIPAKISSYPDAPMTICIIPAIPLWKEKAPSKLMTAHLLEELNLYWMHQPGFMVVERDRLDFVFEELERATSNITESKLKFAVGKIFGAKGILFVRTIPENPGASFPSFGEKTKAFLRYVDTETSVIKAMAEASLKDTRDVKRVTHALGKEILQSLKTSEVR
ncbi:MAG: CHAT domain-containing protein [bacterium]